MRVRGNRRIDRILMPQYQANLPVLSGQPGGIAHRPEQRHRADEAEMAQFRQIERDHGAGGLLFMSRNACWVGDVEGEHDEEDTYLLARGCDHRRRLGHDCDGCLCPVAGAGMGRRRLARRRMEGWRMGTRSRGRGRRWCSDRRRDHRIAAAELCGVSRLRPAGIRTGLLLGIPAGV